MKKQVGIVIILMLFSAGFLQAKPVDLEKAKKVAFNHLQKESRFVKNPNAIRLQSARTTTQALRSDSPNASYYVFNINENQGFIIVSGDDIALPVLAYSDKGKYDESQLPPNFVYWMNGLESEIITAQNQSLQADEKTRSQWNNYLSGNVLRSGSYPQFLVQTQWDQLAPYNLLCPEIGGVETATGCVATAMAQIMKFYNYPAQANPMEAYKTVLSSINIPAIEFPENYDWNNMSLIYDGLNTSEENDAVAALMYHCGVATYMNYDIAANGGSGTDILSAGRAFRDIFDYDPNIKLKERDDYTIGEWKSFLIQEIVNEERPVFYAGTDGYGGHAFVCDGYQSAGDYFHFNWGWGGFEDGWFLLNALNPGTGGAGYGSGVYSYDQMILTHIQPNTGQPAIYDLNLYANLTSSKTTVVRNDAWTISGMKVVNFGLFAFNGSIGAFLVNTNDQIIDTLGIATLKINSKQIISSLSIPCQVRPSTKAGSYRLRIFTKASNASEWTKLTGYEGFVDFIAMTVNTYDPPTTRWNGTSSDWNNGGNWSHGVPGVDSDVTIGTAAAYPTLTGVSYVNDIYFEAGAEIGRQDLLRYRQARLQINFGSSGLERNQWHPMSIPLQQVYTGDFCFGGYPYTFLRQSEWTAVDGQTLPQISWKDIRSHSKPIVPGEGFALWVNSGSEGTKGRSDLSMDGLSGLGLENGIIELPYFEATSQNAMHRIHQYASEQSRFYAFDTGEENFPIDLTSVSVTRNANAYRLANDVVTVNVTFGKYDGKNIALVGNPFMTTIDLEKFYEDNSDVIRPVFLIWQYPDWIVNEDFDTQYIKPMQAFFVEQQETAGKTATVTFRIANISAAGQQ